MSPAGHSQLAVCKGWALGGRALRQLCIVELPRMASPLLASVPPSLASALQTIAC